MTDDSGVVNVEVSLDSSVTFQLATMNGGAWSFDRVARQGRAKLATRSDDGVIFRRVARSRFDANSGCEDTEALYQKIVDDQVMAEEQHRRSPAARSYAQAQACDSLNGPGSATCGCIKNLLSSRCSQKIVCSR